MHPNLNYFIQDFYEALLFCCICIYIHFRTLRTFEGETSEFLLEKCYVNIIWTGACKLLPVLCSPTGGEYFEMGQGFHCEPVIVFQTVWGSGGARKCVWGFLPSSGTVVWAGSLWIQNQCACTAVPSTPARERPAALACIECLKCLQLEVHCGMVERVFVLSLFFCCLLFVFL